MVGGGHAVFEQFYAFRRFQAALSFAPDGEEVLFSSDITGQFDLWRIPATGGWPHQLTTLEDRTVRYITVSPDGQMVVFAADRDGDEFHQLYALPARGGWPQAWTDAAKVQHHLHQQCWSPDGRRLAYAANARVETDMDVWVRHVETGETRHVFGDDQYAFPSSWSPDGRHLLCMDERSNTDTSLHLVDIEAEEQRELTPHEGEVGFWPGPWAADSSGFYVRTDEGREFTGVALQRLDGVREWVATPEADVEALAGSADGRVLVWLENDRGWSRLRALDLGTGQRLPDAQLPHGTCGMYFPVLAVSPDGRYAAVVWSQPRHSYELYVVELATGEARRVTDNMIGGLSEEDLAPAQLVTYPTFDDRDIPAWLYRPEGEQPCAVVLAIHGGPEAQERPEYRPLYQYLVSRGIAVLAPNIRGSTGYGKTYQRLIHRDWGGGDLRDLEHAVLWLREQPWVDPDRIGLYGASYGGFATLSCVARLPQYWTAAVDVVGPSNLVSFTRSVPPPWRRMMAKWVGDPERDPELLTERSPITYVDNVQAPLLVIQGANDPRVVRGESDQMVERLRELGGEVAYVVFEDEGHGFTRRSNQIRAARLTADWLEHHLAHSPAA
ncbi:MAG: S9 family peptidase [Actinomycetota bacterium]|nr:S9 family peptidase [Actinomycetota bacterium]